MAILRKRSDCSLWSERDAKRKRGAAKRACSRGCGDADWKQQEPARSSARALALTPGWRPASAGGARPPNRVDLLAQDRNRQSIAEFHYINRSAWRFQWHSLTSALPGENLNGGRDQEISVHLWSLEHQHGSRSIRPAGAQRRCLRRQDQGIQETRLRRRAVS